MNKSKIVLASIGGVTLVASLALAYFIWSAMSERSERLDELDGAEQSLVNMMKLPVNPCPEAIKAYQANAETYDNWKDDAKKLVTTGDMIFEPTTPPALKAFMVEDARRLSALPGRTDGVIVRPEFAFGFKEFVLDGNMPAEADLAKIQREWYDMSVVVGAMSKSGVTEITDHPTGNKKSLNDPDQHQQIIGSSVFSDGDLHGKEDAFCFVQKNAKTGNLL